MLVTEVVAIRESRIATIASHPNCLHSVRLGSCGARVRRAQSDGYRKSICDSTRGRLLVFLLRAQICYQVFVFGLLRSRHGESQTCVPGCCSWQHDRWK